MGRRHDSTTVDAVRSWANRYWKHEEKEQARQAGRARRVRDALEKWHRWRERAETEDQRLALGVSLHRLPERLRFVIEQRFLTQPPLTLKQVGDRLGVTRARVLQLQQKALRRLGRDIRWLLESEPATLEQERERAEDSAT